MKKLYAIVAACVIAVMSGSVMGEVISQQDALTTAENFLSQDEDWTVAGDATVRLVEHDGVPAYYVVEYAQGGWALVSAQSSTQSVLGYNYTGTFIAPEPMQMVLDARANEIVELARKSDELAQQGLKLAPAAVSDVSYPDVEPFIPINLNQEDPYNKYCPTISGKKALVGCVAVAMTQAMAVCRYPDRPVGRASYNCPNVGVLSINYDEEPAYDWDAVLASDETGDYTEVARILYHAGVSVDMGYSLTFSGAYIDDTYYALYQHFQFDQKELSMIFKAEYNSEDAWLSTIVEDLTMKHPVIYIGAATEDGKGGHCWNLDGWKNSTQMVHVNWGWGGHGDGYFKLDNMHDSYQNISFLYHHAAIVGISGPTTAPYGLSLSNTRFAKGTAAGVALADVSVSCDDENAVLTYELFGPKNITGNNIASPYEVRDGKLVSTVVVEDAKKFQYLLMKVTNENTGETAQKEFTIRIVDDAAVDMLVADNMRIYPTMATTTLTLEVPTQGGDYAIYSVSGAQVASGSIDGSVAEVNVSTLPAGTYYVRYVHEQGVGVKTFIKK